MADDAPKRYKTLAEFYPFYKAEHSKTVSTAPAKTEQ